MFFPNSFFATTFFPNSFFANPSAPATGGIINWVPGNKTIAITGNNNKILDFKNLTIDNLYINSYGSVTFTSGVRPLSFEAYRGAIDFNGQRIETINNFTFWGNATVSGLPGTTIIVGGNARWSGTATQILNLDSTDDWIFNVTGSAVAFNVQVSHSDASAGSTVHAYTSIDHADTHNWLFAYVYEENCQGGLKLDGDHTGIEIGHAYQKQECIESSYRCRLPRQDDICANGIYYRNYGSYVFNRYRDIELQDICGTNIVETTSDCSIAMVSPIVMCRQLNSMIKNDDQNQITEVTTLSLPIEQPVIETQIPDHRLSLTPKVSNLTKKTVIEKPRKPLRELAPHLRRNPSSKDKTKITGKAF